MINYDGKQIIIPKITPKNLLVNKEAALESIKKFAYADLNQKINLDVLKPTKRKNKTKRRFSQRKPKNIILAQSPIDFKPISPPC